jgi:hypothetical protein
VLNFNFQDKYIVFILQKINQFNLKYLYLWKFITLRLW